MGASASVSMGNETVANVTNSTTNEQYFNISNCVNIVNTLKSESNLVASVNEEGMNEAVNTALVTIKDSVIKIGGSNNTVNIRANGSAEQKIELVAELSGYLSHTDNLTDAVAFDISTHGSSIMNSTLTSTAGASQCMECESSGLLAASACVGIGNSVVSNVNNSVRNLFSMAVDNSMSSSTQRESIANSVNLAYAIAKQMADNSATTEIIGTTIDVGGNDNLLNVDAESGSTQGTTLMQSLDTNLSKSVTAATDSSASSYTSVSGDVTTVSTGTAESKGDMSAKTEGLTTGGLLGIVIAIAVVSLAGTIVPVLIKHRNCQKRKAGEELELEDLSEPKDDSNDNEDTDDTKMSLSNKLSERKAEKARKKEAEKPPEEQKLLAETTYL